VETQASILTTSQWEQVDLLAATLDREQAIWVSGYLAGRSQLAPPTRADGPGLAAPAPGALPAGPASRLLTILYATDTGNAKELAGMLSAAAEAKGLTTKVADLAKYKSRDLKDEQDVLMIAATHGEGEPPPAALDFFEFIEGKRAPKLPGIRFSVLALGDSTYEHYCAAGRILDERFEALGAERLADRVECDVDYEDDADAWIAAMADLLEPEAAPAAPAPTASVSVGGAAAPAAPSAFSKRNPFTATVLENIAITGRGSSKETRHVELSLEGSGLTYEPGDALGIVAKNEPALVDRVLEQTGLSGDDRVMLKAGETSLREALSGTLEITASTPRFLTQWAELSGSEELRALTASDQAKARTAYFEGHHVLDIVRQFPVPGVTAEQFVAGLRPLQPRLYSIASSLQAAPDEVHLTVSTVRYELHDLQRIGVASGHLATLTGDEETVPVYVQANDHFHLPEDDDASIIMIGAGTGVAPYRAFMQEREVREATGKSWLFFGERNFRSDFLYQVEWQELLKNGTLSKLDLAFSRDVRTPKTYVQDRLRLRGREVYDWLEDGASLYVCGDATNMAPDVHRALVEIVAEHGGTDNDEAEHYLAQLGRENRYRLDVY
jgi:sulfite reductase (NADPH) flavoprotein alpha-component